jgi:lipopolysaccharide export LptBFGC system permease protein LptF
VAAAAGVAVIAGLGGFAQALLQAAVVPDPDLLVRMGVAALGAGAGIAVPVGVLAGVATGARRMREEGAVLALSAAGAGPAAILPAVVVVAAIGAGAWAGVGHFGEPAARAGLREARVAAAARVRPLEGRTLRVGPWAVAVDGGVLHFAGDEWIGTATSWALSPAQAGVVAVLGGVEARSADARVRMATLEVPLPVSHGGKVSPAERTTPDLARQIAVSAELGRDRYERWILWKRTLLPACLLPLAAAAAALGLGRLPIVAAVGAIAGTWWGVVRVCDQSIGALGPAGAAAVVLGMALAWAGAAWRR